MCFWNDRRSLVCLIMGLTSFVGVLIQATTSWGQECAAIHNIEITYVFGPGDVYVQPGDCVRFVNVHMIEHSAVGLEREFNSGILMPGSTATLRFDEPMVIPYTCGVHPPMVGVIVVGVPGPSGASSISSSDQILDMSDISGDPIAGKKVFNKCKTCHLMEKDGINRIGPNLFGLIGRKSGTATGFKFSRAMKEANIVWSVNSLSRYLIKPKAFVPGTKMAFPGLDTEQEIWDVISYIMEQNQ